MTVVEFRGDGSRSKVDGDGEVEFHGDRPIKITKIGGDRTNKIIIRNLTRNISNINLPRRLVLTIQPTPR